MEIVNGTEVDSIPAVVGSVIKDPVSGRAVVVSSGSSVPNSDSWVLDASIGSFPGENSEEELNGCWVATFPGTSVSWESDSDEDDSSLLGELFVLDSDDCSLPEIGVLPESGLLSVLDSVADSDENDSSLLLELSAVDAVDCSLPEIGVLPESGLLPVLDSVADSDEDDSSLLVELSVVDAVDCSIPVVGLPEPGLLSVLNSVADSDEDDSSLLVELSVVDAVDCSIPVARFSESGLLPVLDSDSDSDKGDSSLLVELSVDCSLTAIPVLPDSELTSALHSVELSRFVKSKPFRDEAFENSVLESEAFSSFSVYPLEEPKLVSVVDDNAPISIVVGDKDTKMNSGALSVEFSSNVDPSSVVEEDSVFDSVEDSFEVEEWLVVEDSRFNSVVDSFVLDSSSD